MKDVVLCVPTLIRYDLLIEMLLSAEVGNVVPAAYIILDNGGKLELENIPDICRGRTVIIRSTVNLGVAKSWNIFLNNLIEKDCFIIICNDDVKFFSDTIEKLINDYDEKFISFPGGVPSANSFSCFLIPQTVVKAVGYFDETISPNYAYFEDNDYHFRMRLLGYDIRGVADCRLEHEGSATVKTMDRNALKVHHDKFDYARQRYIFKWGGEPGKEKYNTPYNKADNM